MAETCPKCGYAGVDTDRCPRCHQVLADYRSYVESLIKTAHVAPGTPVPEPRVDVPSGEPGRPRQNCPGCGRALPPTGRWCTCGYRFEGRGPYEVHRLSFHGKRGTLFGIYIVNLFLTLVTLGIYSFWGRVRVRKYLLSQTEFEDDRLAYHGTGKELLVGWLKALLVFGVPLALLAIVRDFLELPPPVKIVAALLFYGGVAVFFPFAMVSARRYRLSRISWRGIRFSFRGRALEFIRLFIGGLILSVITLGLYYPVFDTRRYAFMTSHAYFGNRKFEFDGRGWDLFGSFVVTLLLTIPTLGLCWFWFLAKKRRYFSEHTVFTSARFRSTVTGEGLLRLSLGNLLLLIVTLGFGWPWVLLRYVEFHLANLSLEGPLDMASIVQEAQAAAPIGEGLASFLDVGFDLG